MSNLAEGAKLTIKVDECSYVDSWQNKQGATMYTYEVVDQDKGVFELNKTKQEGFKEGETFEVTLGKSRQYKGRTIWKASKVFENKGSGGGRSGYVAFEPREQASINASTAIKEAVNLVVAGKIELSQMFASADKIYDYIHSKVLAIDPNAYKMPVAASSTNESTNTQATTQSSNSVAANSPKQEPAYTAVSDDDDLPF